jgi:hypothetical protein
MQTKNLTRHVFPDKEYPNDWHVETINTDSGDIFQAIFSGPSAEERAKEYARWEESKQRDEHRAA